MRAEEVETFDDELQHVTERMLELMHDADGVGLAATQVGILRRFFVCTLDEEDHVLVNPVVTPAETRPRPTRRGASRSAPCASPSSARCA